MEDEIWRRVPGCHFCRHILVKLVGKLAWGAVRTKRLGQRRGNRNATGGLQAEHGNMWRSRLSKREGGQTYVLSLRHTELTWLAGMLPP